MQDISVEATEDISQLNVSCIMAEGAEDKQCTVEMRNAAGDVQHNCINANDGRGASCTLIGLVPGEYMVWAFDEGYDEEPAVKVVFNVTEELAEIPTDC